MCDDNKTREALRQETLCCMYSALVSKRLAYDQMLWQVPIISLTAQAFLLDIAFASADERSDFYRVLSGLASAGIGFASLQLFCRHSALERQTSDSLNKIETQIFKDPLFPDGIHRKPDEIPFEDSNWGIACQRSKPIWKVVLFLISLCGLFPFLAKFCLCLPR